MPRSSPAGVAVMEESAQAAAAAAAAGVPHSAPATQHAAVHPTLRLSPRGAISSVNALLRSNRNLEEEGGADEVYQGGDTWLVSQDTMTRVPPELSPSLLNICKAYSRGLPHDTEMGDDDDDEEDADYEMEAADEEEEDEWELQPFEEGSEMQTMVMYMKKKFDKYWKLSWLDLCIPVILDPQFKLQYIEFRFKKMFGSHDAMEMVSKAQNMMHGLFKEYLKLDDNSPDPMSHMSQGGDVEMGGSDQDPFASWDREVSLSARSTNEAALELESYLKKVPIRRSDQFNILTWWEMSSAEYPTLSRMARDILAVPASTVASESAFSTGSRVLSDFRSRMTPEIVEALVCLQDWTRASANTRRSMDSVHDIIMELEGEEEEEACL